MASASAGRTALITGASRGIGAAIAHGYAAKGAHLLLHHHPESEITDLAERLCAVRTNNGEEAPIVSADLADPLQIEAPIGGAGSPSTLSTRLRLDRVVRLRKVTGFVASVPGFTNQSEVANGASELFREVLGECGRHARSAVGVAMLPVGVPVEVEAVVEVAP